jgi:hypothetical protein
VALDDSRRPAPSGVDSLKACRIDIRELVEGRRSSATSHPETLLSEARRPSLVDPLREKPTNAGLLCCIELPRGCYARTIPFVLCTISSPPVIFGGFGSAISRVSRPRWLRRDSTRRPAPRSPRRHPGQRPRRSGGQCPQMTLQPRLEFRAESRPAWWRVVRGLRPME